MPPDALARLQSDLFAAITGLAVGDAARAVDHVVGDARASAERRLQVYATMYRLRVIEALESQFPRVAHVLGPDAFGAAALAFVADVPSRHPSLRELGRGFAAWLAREGRDARLPPLARLEWARADVFDLADQPALVVDALRVLPPDRFAELPLRLIDAHRFVDVDAATLDLWRRARDNAGDETSDPPSDPIEASGGALVWRQDVSVHHRGLSALERAALDAVAAGTTFGAICERLAGGRDDEAAATQAFTWLSSWVLDGLLTA
jgi:hypothetical protein